MNERNVLFFVAISSTRRQKSNRNNAILSHVVLLSVTVSPETVFSEAINLQHTWTKNNPLVDGSVYPKKENRVFKVIMRCLRQLKS